MAKKEVTTQTVVEGFETLTTTQQMQVKKIIEELLEKKKEEHLAEFKLLNGE